MLARFAHEPEIEREVVDTGYLHGEEFFGFEEMVQIGAAVLRVHKGVAAGVYGREVVRPFGVAHVEHALGGKEHGVAAVARGHHAVEHIHAALYGFEDIYRRANAHEIARAVGGQNVIHHLNHFVHLFRRLAHGQSADGVALRAEVAHELGTLAAQLGIDATLHDGEECLAVTVFRFCFMKTLPTAFHPAVRQVETLACVGKVSRSRGTFVESHHDVSADGALDVHHLLGREEMLAAVDVGAELATLFREFANAREGKHLKAAAVGEHGAVETVELMQAAGLFYNVQAGSQVEVIGVAEDNLRLDVVSEFAQVHAFHAAERAHRHEDGRFNLAVVGFDDTCSGVAAGEGMLEGKVHCLSRRVYK